MPRPKSTKPPQKRTPKVENTKVEIKQIAIEQEDSMKITKETPKWGQFTVETHNLTFIGEELVEMTIPYDEQNPVNHKIICINGNQFILGVDETLKVPKSLHDNWNGSVKETNQAKRKMSQMTELKV